MKMHAGILAVSLTALALGGCGKKVEPRNETAATAANTMNAAGDAPLAESAGQGFANALAASDRFEIESSRLAEANSRSASVKKFAASMIKAHTDSTAQLNQAVASGAPALTINSTLTGDHQRTLADLQGKSGAEFDAAYIAAQQKGHQETLEKLKSYSAGGDISSLRDLATELVPVVTGHLNMAKGLKP